MSEIIIQGGCEVYGEIRANGAKNSALALLAASILTNNEVVLHNIPDISDVRNMLNILGILGCEVQYSGHTAVVCAKNMDSFRLPCDYSKKIRSSVFLTGPLVSRLKKAVVCFPGGCNIGERPIDMHLRGLERIGVNVREEDGDIICEAADIAGAKVVLQYPSVGATENVLMAACLSSGVTEIINAAREPEISDLAGMLRAMGADISGDGSGRIIIRGKKELHGCEYSCIPDRIESGSYIACAAAARGRLAVRDVFPEHMDSFLSVIADMGVKVVYYNNAVCIDARTALHSPGYKVMTQPYPGFATDMQPQTAALMAVADGESYIEENVFENRLGYVEELIKMGADINCHDRIAVINGRRLCGACITAGDLRGGAAMVTAAVGAEGTTTIQNSDVICRGYEDITGTLASMGVNIS